MSEVKFQSTTDKAFGEMVLRLIEENNRLQGENNTLLKMVIALSTENNSVLKEDHAIIASIDENVRKIKINTN